jgi:hypothetical protein
MKISIPTLAPGKVILCPAALPPAQRGRAIIDPTPEQLAQVNAGENWWTPTGEGTGTLSAPPAVVPQEVAGWKALAIMELSPLGEGTVLSAALAAIAALPTEQERVIARNILNAPTFRRPSATMAALAAGIGLTLGEIDAMFLAAAAIQD